MLTQAQQPDDQFPSDAPKTNEHAKNVTPSQSSTHPTKKSGLDRTAFSDPNLAKPVGERQESKQTTYKIKKPEGRFFRIHPDDATRLYGATVVVTKSGKIKVLTNGVTTEKRLELQGVKALKQVDLYLACDEDGSIFVTYFTANNSEMSESWKESGRAVVTLASKSWISIEANMHEGGYRVKPSTNYPTLSKSLAKWELPSEDDPVEIFESVIIQNTVDNDDSVTITTLLAARK